MTNAPRFLTAIATILTGVEASRDTADPALSTTAPIEMIDMSAGEEAAAWREVALFAEAGLPLPPVTIRRHHDAVACSGHDGLHRMVGTRSVIDICTTESAWPSAIVPCLS